MSICPKTHRPATVLFDDTPSKPVFGNPMFKALFENGRRYLSCLIMPEPQTFIPIPQEIRDNVKYIWVFPRDDGTLPYPYTNCVCDKNRIAIQSLDKTIQKAYDRNAWRFPRYSQ